MDKPLQATFKRIKGRGPMPYPYVRDEYRSAGGYPANLPEQLEDAAVRWPDRVSLSFHPGVELKGKDTKYYMDCWVQIN